MFIFEECLASAEDIGSMFGIGIAAAGGPLSFIECGFNDDQVGQEEFGVHSGDIIGGIGWAQSWVFVATDHMAERIHISNVREDGP